MINICLQFYISIFLFLIHIKITIGQNCRINDLITNTECFNNVFIFNNKPYRAGNFAINKNGDLIIEYSTGRSRLFFGFKKDGHFFFNGENHTREIETIISNDEDVFARYESKNIFISLEDDINKEKQYLFSISTYITLSELIDLENNNYTVIASENFAGNRIFSFRFSILETQKNNTNIYFLIYAYENYLTGRIHFSIKKFGFTSFSLYNYDNIKNVDSDYYISIYRTINAFLIEEDEILAIFFVNNNNALLIYFYDYEIECKGYNSIDDIKDYSGKEAFFKSFYLDNYLAVLIYFYDLETETSLVIKLLSIIKSNDQVYNAFSKFGRNINEYQFRIDAILNDFVKINNEKLVFISTRDSYTLFILFFDFYENYEKMILRSYIYRLDDYQINKELSAFIYNNYLVFSSTVENSSTEMFSIFMIFGYANGIDDIIDIYPYFTDIEDYDSNNNIITKLLEGLTIDNNIFGYIPSNKIKLVSIPNEIIFYNGNEITPLANEDILEFNHRFEQNKQLIKTDEYYSLDYQHIIQESYYELFNQNAHEVIFCPNNINDPNYNFTPQYFYGRINTVKFKLCHEYCSDCKQLGISNNNQQCMSCLPQYQYDYFSEYPSNCVPEGYFNDKEESKLVECTNTNSKYYINTENNKRICFKITYDCPSEYPYWNRTTNECQNYNTFITTITIQTTIPTTYINKITDVISSNNEKLDKLFLYNNIINNIIPIYQSENGETIVIEDEDNYIYQLTTGKNEINSLNNNNLNNTLSIIDISDCEKLLKNENNINESTSLIILKYEKLTNISSQRNIQYEVFNPNTKKKLNLSICSNTTINIYIPVTIDENNLFKYNSSSEYYNDYCFPYKTEFKTDIILEDRREEFINNNMSLCEDNCEYSEYNLTNKKIKCECDVKIQNKFTKEFEINKDKLINIFKDIEQISNIYVIKCYKLLFSKDGIKKNIGNYIISSILLLTLILSIIFKIKGYGILLEKVYQISNNEINEENGNNTNRNNYNINETKKVKNKGSKKKKRKKNKKIIKTKNIKVKKKNETANNPPKKKLKDKNDTEIKNIYFTNNDITDKSFKNKNKNETIKYDNYPIITNNKKENKITNKNSVINYNDYELNNLSYQEALESDKRSYFQYYISLIKRKQLIIFSFYTKDDYNSKIIKICLFLSSFALYCTINTLFFDNPTLHQIYVDKGSFNFIFQIPQILYSTIISSFINIIIKLLSLSEKNILEIKNEKNNKIEKSKKIIKCLNIKFILFFIISIIFLLLFWFYISCFCAVYSNTQIHIIKDILISFGLSLLYPFGLNLLPGLFRIPSLKSKEQNKQCMYNCSKIIQLI